MLRQLLPRTFLAGWFCVGGAGCAGGPTDPGDGDKPFATAPDAHDPAFVEASAPGAVLPTPVSLLNQDLTAGVLMPRERPDDSQVMKVAGFSIRKSHLYDRLFEDNPQFTKLQVDALVFDILLAKRAQQHKVFVDPKMIDKIVKDEEQRLVDRVARDFKGRFTLDEFLQLQKGVSLATHRVLLRRRMARRLFRYYVLRYLALVEDRVQVRIISHRERAKIDEILKKARDGADFRSLALRESEHLLTQRRGGLLPPLARDNKEVYVKTAFALKPGDVSDVLTVNRDGVSLHYILYCVAHMAGRKLTFEQAKAELDRDWLKNPVTPEEEKALYLRLRLASEGLKNGSKNR